MTWDGRNNHGHQVASGVYFIYVRAAGETATGKMLLLR
jgi:hypothetical protein